jgi:hypothetical protein
MSGIQTGYTSLQLHGWAHIIGNAVTPTFARQSGMIASVVHTGAGNYSFTLGADYAIDDIDMVCLAQVRTAIAASGAAQVAVSSTSDTVKVIDIAQEAGAGGASTLVDTIDLDWVVFKRLL